MWGCGVGSYDPQEWGFQNDVTYDTTSMRLAYDTTETFLSGGTSHTGGEMIKMFKGRYNTIATFVIQS
jgi:hypothetical protein